MADARGSAAASHLRSVLPLRRRSTRSRWVGAWSFAVSVLLASACAPNAIKTVDIPRVLAAHAKAAMQERFGDQLRPRQRMPGLARSTETESDRPAGPLFERRWSLALRCSNVHTRIRRPRHFQPNRADRPGKPRPGSRSRGSTRIARWPTPRSRRSARDKPTTPTGCSSEPIDAVSDRTRRTQAHLASETSERTADRVAHHQRTAGWDRIGRCVSVYSSANRRTSERIQ